MRGVGLYPRDPKVLSMANRYSMPPEGRLAVTPRPVSMYQFQRTSDSKRIHQNDTDGDADAELVRQQNRPNFIKAKDMAQVGYAKGKIGFDWLWQKSGILGNWMNKQAGKMGMESARTHLLDKTIVLLRDRKDGITDIKSYWLSHCTSFKPRFRAFWPTSLDKECDKCARILYTFTQRQDHQPVPNQVDPYSKRKTQKVIKKIPLEVIRKAEGLAIFTIFRTGLGWSAASGSGIVISRDSPTTWGPPSGILIHTIGVGFLAGIDVYDAVLVLRTRKAVMAFAKPKVSLGAELAVVAGEFGNGMSLETGLEASPVFAYTKSKGIYGGLQLDGNIVIERGDENARFYGRRIKAEQLLNGGAVAVPRAASGLIATIEVAEGKPVDIDELPEDIDVAPSEQSTGVETVQESRERARAEAAEAGVVEPGVAVPSSTVFSGTDRGTRRRTLPPLPLRLPRALADQAGGGTENDADKLRPRPLLSPLPPPRPARRNISNRHSIDGSSRSIETGSHEQLSVHSTIPESDQTEPITTYLDDKPPAPFKLHSASPSQSSVKVSASSAEIE
ncbi:hypothetical protein CROQUDRAFT_99275 [Cronartium quercuum f. sp. fusiforme G11]|uniref:Ysc84 actin-binding domain-containing protein n=1 Tax=Cronartium quercuum f. sp. fusiforme G11 TaxID=708437 RepID=A0A9P6T6Y6_9BASI|nr:hypothetical protein CROQUDRAFT_99275 [Cronartium quercuum f. sp. fusiforme G11]